MISSKAASGSPFSYAERTPAPINSIKFYAWTRSSQTLAALWLS